MWRVDPRQFWPDATTVLGYLGLATALALFVPGAAHSFLGGGLCAISFLLVICVRQLRLQNEELEDDARKAIRRSELLENEARRQREIIDALADGLDIAIFLCGPRSTIEYANRKATELFRFEDPRGRNIVSVTISHELEGIIARAVETRRPQEAEITFRYPNERIGLTLAWTDPQAPERVFVTVYDISNLRRLERARRDFVANVSHELRTPMTTIRAMAETLYEGDDEDYNLLGKKYLGRIINEVDRLTLISEDLLTLSVAESNPVVRTNCDFAEIVRRATEDLAERAASKGIELEVESPSSLLGHANPHQLMQVAVNLIENAINYTNEGSVTVTLTDHDANVILSVKDTGIGIPEEHIGRVFERFYRIDKGRSRATGGTGLGLSIVKHIVEAHGGKVSVQSVPGQGTEFTVDLPKN